MREGAGSTGQSPIEGERKYGVATDRRGPAGIWLRAQDGSEAFAPVHSTPQPIVPGDCLSWIPTYRSGTVGAEAASIRSETLGTLGCLRQPKVATAEPQIPAFVFNDEAAVQHGEELLDQVLECLTELKHCDELAQWVDDRVNDGTIDKGSFKIYERAVLQRTGDAAAELTFLVSAINSHDRLQAQQKKGAQL